MSPLIPAMPDAELFFKTWNSRAPEDKTLDIMGFGVSEDEDGFLYVWIGV